MIGDMDTQSVDLTHECEHRGLTLRLGIAEGGVQTIILSRTITETTATMEVFECETVRDAMAFLAGWDAAVEDLMLEDAEAEAEG